MRSPAAIGIAEPFRGDGKNRCGGEPQPLPQACLVPRQRRGQAYLLHLNPRHAQKINFSFRELVCLPPPFMRKELGQLGLRPRSEKFTFV